MYVKGARLRRNFGRVEAADTQECRKVDSLAIKIVIKPPFSRACRARAIDSVQLLASYGCIARPTIVQLYSCTLHLRWM